MRAVGVEQLPEILAELLLPRHQVSRQLHRVERSLNMTRTRSGRDTSGLSHEILEEGAKL
jgi:hypothetical protein